MTTAEWGHSCFSLLKNRCVPVCQNGFVLLPVILLIALLATVIFLLSRDNASGLASGAAEAEATEALYVAEAGVQHARLLTRTADCSNYANLTNVPFGDHSYSVVVAPSEGSPITFQSTAALNSGAAATVQRAATPVYSTTATTILTQQPGPEGKDTFILVDRPDENRGNHSDLITDSETAGQGPIHALLQLDLSAIPSSAFIESATLQLYLYDDAGSGDVVEAHALQRDWVEGVGGVDDGANWNTSDGSLAWSNPGGDYDSEIAGSFVTTGVGWKNLYLTALTQDWVDGTRPNYGIALISPPASGNNPMLYRSGDYNEPTFRPKFTVTYACECGKPCADNDNTFFLSTDSEAELGGLGFQDTDLIKYYRSADTATLTLDSFAVGLTKKIDALHVLENGHLILSVDAGTTFAGLSVGSEDLFEYDPVAGTATMYLEADVHFQTKKNIISVHVLDNGNTVLSTDGGATLGGLAFSDRDLVEYNRFTGAASIYFDGDATTLSQRISAVHIADNGHIVLAPDGDTTLGGLSFGPDQLVDYDPVADLAVLYFDGETLFSATSEKVTAVHIGAGSGSIVPTIGSQHVLFVVGSVAGAGPTTEELAHRTLIESWGYSVALIDDDASQAEFDIAVTNNDVVFMTNDITASNLNTKLVDATIGVVTSEDNLSDEFGLSSTIGWNSGNLVEVNDNTHYITLPFATGLLTILSASESLAYVSGTLAADLGQLASSTSGYGIVTLESGATTYSGGTAAGRRAQLPWGGSGFDPNNLNADGLTILRRALEWGAGAVVAPNIHLSTDSDAILGGLSFQDTDVARYQSTTDMAELYLDSLAAGLDKKVDALHILADGHLILSTQADATFGGLTFKSEDLVEYDPVAGTATMYLEADVHFDSMKDIISVHILDNGNAVLSTSGDAILGGLAFSDRDLVEYDRGTGTASIFFDGDATTLSQRISAVHILPNGNIILAPEGDTTLGGLSFGPDQLVEYNPVLDLAILYFDGETLFSETSEKVRSVHIGSGSGASGGGAPVGKNVLLIVGNDTTLSSKDVGYKALMESWGHTVAVLDDGASQADYDTAMAAADVIYASGSASGPSMLDKATDTTKGLVNEVNGKIDNFGFSSSTSATANFDTFSTTDAAHYITEPFSGNPVTVFTSFLTNPVPGGTLAPDLQNVGTVSGTPSLVTLEAGATRYNSTPSPGRRAHLPFTSAETTEMTADGKTILQRAIEWAAGAGGGGGGGGGSGSCDGTFRDEFNAQSFSGSDGTLTWATDWIEVGESDGATSGDIQVRTDQSNYQLRTRDNDNGGEGVEREADLSGAASATLTYDYRRMSLDSASDYTSVEVSPNGVDWTVLTLHQGSTNDSSYQPASHNISASDISATTRIRFKTSSSMGGTDTVWFDNVEIACTP